MITARLLLLIGSCKYEACLVSSTRSEAVKLTKQRPTFEVRLENKFTFDKLPVVSVSLLIARIVETSADPDGEKEKKKKHSVPISRTADLSYFNQLLVGSV